MKKTRAKSKPRKFSKKAVIGVLLLVCSFLVGALLRNSAQITNSRRGFGGTCDTRITWLCIPTYYFSIPIGTSLWLELNTTSLLSSAIFFVVGIVLVRE